MTESPTARHFKSMARQEQQDMGTVDNGFSADGENSVDAAWSALCAELEATVSGVAARFAQAENAHLSFTEVHDLAQLVDLAEDGLPLDLRLVDFATQCLVQVAERAARTRFRPNYFSEYKCLDALWEEASAHRKHNPSTVQYEAEAQPAS